MLVVVCTSVLETVVITALRSCQCVWFTQADESCEQKVLFPSDGKLIIRSIQSSREITFRINFIIHIIMHVHICILHFVAKLHTLHFTFVHDCKYLFCCDFLVSQGQLYKLENFGVATDRPARYL